MEGVASLYEWLFETSPTLNETRDTLTPRLRVYAYPNGRRYDVTVSFFVQNTVCVPIMLLPREHVETLLEFIETTHKTRGFATIRPAISGSAMMVFQDCVWDEMI